MGGIKIERRSPFRSTRSLHPRRSENRVVLRGERRRMYGLSRKNRATLLREEVGIDGRVRQNNKGIPVGVEYAGKNTPSFIVIHHTDNARKRGTQAGSVEATHRNRDYPLSVTGHQCGYHYILERDGTVIKCREEWEEGAHTLPDAAKTKETGINFKSIGISLAGDFTRKRPTHAQLTSLHALIAEIKTRYPIDDSHIVPHSHFSQTSCPGTDIGNLLR